MSDLARRQRARAATEQEIRQHARAVLVEHGRDGLTVRAIAGGLGMTAPALYRYFASREDLLLAVAGDICADLAAEISTAAAQAPAADGVAAVLAACRAFRRWALAHPQEFGLAFATSGQGCEPGCELQCQCGHAQFARAFLGVGLRLVSGRRLPADDPLSDELVGSLQGYRQELLGTAAAAGIALSEQELTTGVVYRFLKWWARLYGQVALEVFGLFRFAVDDAEPLFEAMLTEIADELAVAMID